MCGIAGIVLPDGGPANARGALVAMRKAQRARGPDDAGEHWDSSERVGLANCRLAIRDPSPAGHMPMCAREVCITYNGEIYNAGDLRAELGQAGHHFVSRSDTEVILRGYMEWGRAILLRLRGMYAFGIHDERNGTLLLARDPLGIKPLYYSLREPFCFASEIQALIASGLVARELDDEAISAYLQLGSIPAPLTIYRDVRALLPGHSLVVANDGSTVLERFWDLPRAGADAASHAELEAALSDAVRSHLVADVPVGAFLSGGLDSSAVVALASEWLEAPMHTCSIAFESAAHDESKYARAVAEQLGTVHHERVVTRADFMGSLDTFVRALDQPSVDGFNTYFAARTAHEAGVKVVLSGLGGDELFGGYPSFRGVPRLLRALRVVRPLGAARVIERLGRSARWNKVAAAARRPVTPASAWLVYRGLFTAAESARLFDSGTHFDALRYVAERAGTHEEAIEAWVSRAELTTYTASQLLRDADVMSMAHSLELRVPLLDTRLVELLARLPAAQRFKGAGSKPLLRRLVAERLPPTVTEARPRQGFTFPLEHWLRESATDDMWQFDAPIFRRFDDEVVSAVRTGFMSGHTHWSRVWALMALNEWSRRSAHA